MRKEKNETKSPEVNLIIGDRLLNQINYLHTRINNREWSGILHYEFVDKKEEFPEERLLSGKTITIKALDMYPMNIGSSVYTDFRNQNEKEKDYNTFFNPKYYDDLFNPPELHTGLIHTHHSMATFFSDTDLKELDDNFANYILFLSLIVNYDHSYTAKVVVGEKSTIKTFLPKRKRIINKFIRTKVLEEETELKEEVLSETVVKKHVFNCNISFETPWIKTFEKVYSDLTTKGVPNYENYYGIDTHNSYLKHREYSKSNYRKSGNKKTPKNKDVQLNLYSDVYNTKKDNKEHLNNLMNRITFGDNIPWMVDEDADFIYNLKNKSNLIEEDGFFTNFINITSKIPEKKVNKLIKSFDQSFEALTFEEQDFLGELINTFYNIKFYFNEE